jgi:hypothetical protein
MRNKPLTGTLSFLCGLIQVRIVLMTSLRSGFPKSLYSGFFQLKCTIRYGSLFQIVKLKIPNSKNMSDPLFIFLFSNSKTLQFSFDDQKRRSWLYPWFYFSGLPVNCRNRNVEFNFRHTPNYSWDICSSGILCTRSLKVGYQRFGTNCQPNLQGSSSSRNVCNY